MLTGLGVLPSFIIMFIILKNAVSKKEPFKKVASVIAISAISVIPAVVLEAIGQALLQGIMGVNIDTMTMNDMDYYIKYLFFFYIFVVGIAEEACKFFTFKWIIFHDRDFDNTYDGLIYGAASALGFATLENLLYIFQSEDSLNTAIMRALLSIPLHAVTGIFMGYYFGVLKYRKYNNVKPNTHPEIPAYIFSVILHGLFDFSITAYGMMSAYDELMDEESTETPLYLLLFIATVAVCYLMIIITIVRAKKHSYNIYNRYYYENLNGSFQDIMGGKTSDKKPTFFGMPLPMMYSRRPDQFNPYNPYVSNNAPPPMYGQQYNQPRQYGQQQYAQYDQQSGRPQPPPQYNQPPQFTQYAPPPVWQNRYNAPPPQTAVRVSVKPAPAAAERICSSCGARASSASKFCSICGNPLK